MSHRHESLAADRSVRERLILRSEIIAHIRAFFRFHGFLEVETPTVVPAAGMEPHLEPFRTVAATAAGSRHAAYLITSPEYAMKKLLAAGFPKIFELARCYRNEEPWDGAHNPEFTMLEWYRANADYREIMRDTEEMVAEVARRSRGGTEITYLGRPISLEPPWDRKTVAQAFAEHAGFDLDAVVDDGPALIATAREHGFEIADDTSFEDAFFKIFLTAVEPKLGSAGPVILYDWPASMAALSRIKTDDPRYAERFEVYCGGMELANAFTELNDADEQRARLVNERDQRVRNGKEAIPLDEEFLHAVGTMPGSAGIALGVDRLVMLLTNAPSIRDVLFFPAAELFSEERDHQQTAA